MGRFNPKTKDWLDQLSAYALEHQKNPSALYEDQVKTLNISLGTLHNLRSLQRIFDPLAVEKVRKAAVSPPAGSLTEPAHPNQVPRLGASAQGPFKLSLRQALALTALDGKVPDLPKAVHEALDVILSRHLARRKIEALVVHMVSGKPASDFDHTKVPYKKQEPEEDPSLEEEDSEEEVIQKPTKMKKSKRKGAKKTLKALQKAGAKGFFFTLKTLASLIHQYITKGAKTTANYFIPLRSHSSSRSGRRHGSGQSLPNPFSFVGHWGLYWFIILFTYGSVISIAGHFIPGVGPWIDSLRRFLFHFILHLPLWLLAQALAKPWVVLVLAVALVWWIHKEFRTGLMATLIVAAVLGAGWFFRSWIMEHLPTQINPFSPPSLQDTKNDQALDNAKIQSPITTTAQAAGSPMEPAQARPHSQKKLSAPKQEGVATMPKEDRASLEAEILALPRPCRVKDFSIEPDANMGAEMAGRRFMDIQDPEKYSFWLGPDEKKITSAVVNGSGFNLEIQGGFSFGDINPVLGDSSKKGMAFYWEDVRAIHCCEVEVLGDHPRTFYQFSMQFAGLKKPFAVQCESVEDLAHLVSGSEFWVRNAQGGKNAPIGPLPYLYQGLLMGSDGEVTGTWDNSPIAKAGLVPGDHIWSVDSNPGMRMGNEELLSSLQDLSPGPHALFVVDPGEWVKGMSGPRNRTLVFNPKKTRLPLLVQ